jgi:hypothetical protein
VSCDKWRSKNNCAHNAGVKHFLFPHTPGSRPDNQVIRPAHCGERKQFMKFSPARQCARQTLEFYR